MAIKCRKCGTPDGVRVSQQEGAFGPLNLPFCEVCYRADCAERRREAKLFGERLSLPAFSKLTPADQAAWVDA